MFRARPGSLALTAIGLVAAAILGVQLGQSAISEINPIHFQGPVERPRAITPPPEPAAYDPYGQSYVWSMPRSAPLPDCDAACAAERAREAVSLAMDEPAGRDAALPVWRDATPATELRPWAPGALADRDPDVERYMHYPVNREQAEEAAAKPVSGAPALPAEALRPPPALPASVVEN